MLKIFRYGGLLIAPAGCASTPVKGTAPHAMSAVEHVRVNTTEGIARTQAWLFQNEAIFARYRMFCTTERSPCTPLEVIDIIPRPKSIRH